MRRRKLLRLAYVAYGFVFVGFIGGIVEILAISDEINHGLVVLLEKNSSGPELHGRFLFPRNWLALFVTTFLLMLLFPATSVLRFFTEIRDETDPNSNKKLSSEIVALRQDVDDIMRHANNITSYIYSVSNAPRFDIVEIDLHYNIAANGDTATAATLKIECNKDPAHFWKYWIDADVESSPVTSFRQLNFQAKDVGSGKDLDSLPIRSSAHLKEFAIFFPEMRPGDRKTLRVAFSWPGFMKKFTELGAANYKWGYRSENSERGARLRHEWMFEPSGLNVRCRMAGQESSTATLRCELREGKIAWIYEDPSARMDGTTYAVEFSR